MPSEGGVAEMPKEPELSQRTSFPRCEPRLRPLLDGYLKYVREYTQDPTWYPHKGLLTQWYNGARQTIMHLDEHKVPENDWYEFAYWGCTVMDRDGLDNKTPRSIGYLAKRWKTEGNVFSESARLRYLEGDL